MQPRPGVDHPGQHAFAGMHGGHQVHGETPLPGVELRPKGERRRIVDQYVHATQRGARTVQEAPQRLGVANIAGLGMHADAGRPQLGLRLPERRLRARADRKIGAFCRESQCDAATDAAARAGDDAVAPAPTEIHRLPYLPSCARRSASMSSFFICSIAFIARSDFARVGIADQLPQHAGHDLPGDAELVLEPAALLGLRVAAGAELVPVVVDLLLRLANDDRARWPR